MKRRERCRGTTAASGFVAREIPGRSEEASGSPGMMWPKFNPYIK
jgi:hypothetical protein